MAEAADDSPRSCASFWGPFRPLVGGHTIAEAGGSSYAPTWLLFLTRSASAAFMLGTLVYYSITGDYSWRFYSVWCHLGVGLAFLLSALLSLLLLARKRTLFVSRPSFRASLTVIVSQVFASAALFLDVVFWALLFEGTADFATIVMHAINLALFAVEILLALRMQYKLLYISFFVVFTCAYLGFSWIYFAIRDEFIYDILDVREQSAGVTVATYIGLFLWGIVAGIIVLLVSRLNRLPCLPSPSGTKDIESGLA